MSGLPPTVPVINKVKIRNKSNSFKKPSSCHTSEVNKKETKGLFFNLRKGSSNSKLNEDVENKDVVGNPSPKNNVFKEDIKIVGRIQGRNFDSDDDDADDFLHEETSVTKMDKLFEDYKKVVNNPALIGYLLKYLLDHNIDYYGLLYYLVVQHYKATIQIKDFGKDAQRFANEILTTFIHDKSNLKVDHIVDVSKILNDLKDNTNLLNIFDKSSEEIYFHCIKTNINRLRQSITHGLSTFDISVSSFNFDSKMNFFNECIKSIIKDLENKIPRETNNTVTKEIKDKEHYMQDIIAGVKTSLATIYFYFSKKEKDENSDSVSTLSNKNLRTSFLGKSTESLQVMTNCVLDKQSIFCSKLHKKTQNHSFFKKGKSYKGHNFLEKTFGYPRVCLICEKLLWGINPQGFICSYCQEAVHKNCRDDVRSNCCKEPNRFQRNLSNITQPFKDDSNVICGGEEDNISTNSQTNNNNNNEHKFQDSRDYVENDNSNQIELQNITGKHMDSSISSENYISDRPNCVVSTATIYITNIDDRMSINQETESVDSFSDINTDRQECSKADYELKSDSQDERSHVRNIALKYDQKSIIPRSQSSDDNIENKTLPRSSKRGSQSVQVQDLVVDSNAWVNDPDMCVEETFEANKELDNFKDHLTKEDDKAEYNRLLVLMEFHHKIKFTVMTLKRFDYLLIKRWPNDDTLLFKTLSLNNITPLYELIKTLDFTIEKCKLKASYSQDMAQNVLEWLVSNQESNLQEWLKYSIDICCTNSLNLVKNSWKEFYRSDYKFAKVLSIRHNKMTMVEQLSNMRPLLFNLPLIVNKIIKDLNKFNKYKDEIKLWKEIYEKFRILPTFIDEHCMPLVQLINSGTILNSFDRSSWSTKLSSNDPCFDYILDFPKTAFHHKLFDCQEIKVSDIRESGEKNKTPAVFVKEMTDVYSICYDNMLVLLQKENEKYHLKQFKATDTSKMNPTFILDNVHTTKGEKKGQFYEMTLVFINVAVLAHVLFTKKDVFKRWHDLMLQKKSKSLKIKSGVELENEVEYYNETEIETYDNNIDKYFEIKEKFQEFSLAHSLLFKQDYLMEFEDQLQNALYEAPRSSNEFVIGTSFDALNILKICYDSLSVTLNDNTIDNLMSLLSNMEIRISSYRNLMSNSGLIDDNIESEISETQEEIRNKILMDSSHFDYNHSDFVEKYVKQIIEDAVKDLDNVTHTDVNQTESTTT